MTTSSEVTPSNTSPAQGTNRAPIWPGLLALGVWSAIFVLPFLFFANLPDWSRRHVAAILITGSGFVLVWLMVWAGIRYSARTPEVRQRQERLRDGLTAWGNRLLVLELAVAIRILAQTEPALAFVVPAYDGLFQLLSPVIPALGRMPQALMSAGFGPAMTPERISTVTGCFAVGYLGAILIMTELLWRSVPAVRRRSLMAQMAEVAEFDSIRRALAMITGPFVVALIAWVLIADPGVSLHQKRYRRSIEWLWNFELDNLDLILRATFSPLFWAFTVVIMLFGLAATYVQAIQRFIRSS